MLYTVISSIAWIPVTGHIFSRVFWVLSGLALGGLVSPFIDMLIWWLGFDLSVLCMVYLLIQSFWRYLDRPGRVWNELNRNSYGVYIIHVIVVGAIALFLLNLAIPSLLKSLILVVSAYLASNLIVSLYRRAVTKIRAITSPEN